MWFFYTEKNIFWKTTKNYVILDSIAKLREYANVFWYTQKRNPPNLTWCIISGHKALQEHESVNALLSLFHLHSITQTETWDSLRYVYSDNLI